MSAAALTKNTQVIGNIATAIDTTDFQPRLLDQTQQTLIIASGEVTLVRLPRLIAAGMDSHHMAEPANQVLHFVCLNEGVPYRDGLASVQRPFLGYRAPR